MENSRTYKSNYVLIALLVFGTILVILDVLMYIINGSRILLIDLGLGFFKFSLFEIEFIVVDIASAALVTRDADRIDAGKAYPKQKTFRASTWTPGSWGALVFFLWIFIFPAYMYMREDIFWKNISVEYGTLKTIERDVKPRIHIRPHLPHMKKKKEYSDNVGVCPSCDTPYPLKMLERSKYCNRCGELLKED